MSKSGILEALRTEEKALKTQLVAIQRAIEAIELADAPAPAARGRKKARKVAVVAAAPPKRKRAMTEEQRRATLRADAEILGRRDAKKKLRVRQVGAERAGEAPAWAAVLPRFRRFQPVAL